jgi:hypothetical protein
VSLKVRISRPPTLTADNGRFVKCPRLASRPERGGLGGSIIDQITCKDYSWNMAELYIPQIENGIPIPEPPTTVYPRKIVGGELMRIAEKIKPGTIAKRAVDGQSVVLPAGSIGKFKKIVKSRGLKTVCFISQSDTEARVWVVK